MAAKKIFLEGLEFSCRHYHSNRGAHVVGRIQDVQTECFLERVGCHQHLRGCIDLIIVLLTSPTSLVQFPENLGLGNYSILVNTTF